MGILRALGFSLLSLSALAWAGPRAPTMPPEVKAFLSGEVHASPTAIRLGIRSPRDMMRYFELHRSRLKVLVRQSEQSWQELARILEIPPGLGSRARLRKAVSGLIAIHDQAKMDPLVAKGLLKIFGRNLSSLPPESPERQFVHWFNSWDDEFGADYFRARSIPPKLREFSLFVEKTVDIEDRIRSPDAEIEFARPREAVSERATTYLEPLLEKFSKTSPEAARKHDQFVALFRKMSGELTAVYDQRTRQMHFGRSAAGAFPGCAGAALKRVLSAPSY